MPRKILNLTANRVTGTSTPTLIGTAISVYNQIATADGGYIINPFRVPTDFDPSYGANLFQTIWNGALNVGAGRVIIFEYRVAFGSTGDSPSSSPIQHIYVASTPWPATQQDQWKLVFNDPVPDDFTFPPGTLEPDSVVGVQVRRLGTNAGDTYAGTVNLASALVFEYQQRCQMPCCG